MSRDELRDFCPNCFADGQGGSWNHIVVGQHCTNCGAHGTIAIPVWAIECIRSNASWVGKRYYPSEEDFDRRDERDSLLKLVDRFPGRTAVQRIDQPDRWDVRQALPKGSIETTCTAKSEDEALRNCGLRYVPEEALR